ncbi:hypothetical protein CQA66_05685 [Helicobacter aurati]|uniref:Protein hydE n=1 Tax=Helicobacter aurati TaxID=137778 RepID=A0A3D8J344_9HELI|nr:hypothetical protein [Helicobacter aurati]RDU71952.1 hypothetical protein CQA66_05685 [Helicobacter aurati]
MKEEVITAETDSLNKASNDKALTCIFIFYYTESLSAQAMIMLLKNLTYSFLRNTIQSLSDNHEQKDDSILLQYQYDIAHPTHHINTQHHSKKFSILIYANPQTILAFSDMLSSHLPLSLHFVFSKIQPLDSQDLHTIRLNKWESFNPADMQRINPPIPTVKMLEEITDNQNPNFCCINNFITPIKCSLDSYNARYSLQDFHHVSSQKYLIECLTTELLLQKQLLLQCNNVCYMLSIHLHKTQSKAIPHIIFADLYNAISYLRLHDSQKKALASIEKPFVLAHCKEVFTQAFNAQADDKIFASLPNDYLLLLLLHTLQTIHNIDYLFFTIVDNSTKEPLLSYKENYKISDNKQVCYTIASHSSYSLSHNRYGENLFELLAINPLSSLNTTNITKRLVVCLSRKNPSAFWIENSQGEKYQQILDINFSPLLCDHLQRLFHYKNGDKLLHNFAKTHQEITQHWGLESSFLQTIIQGDYRTNKTQQSKESNSIQNNKQCSNLLELFQLIQQMLQLDSHVMEYANKCVRDRGPRIDYKLIRVDDNIELDYPRILRSVMSFYLAGVENELLCYGVIESLAEFVGTLAGDMLINYGIDRVFVCGDLLLEQCFLDKIIQAIPKNISLALPNENGVDYL